MSTLTLDMDIAKAREAGSPSVWRGVFQRIVAQYSGSLRRTCRGYEREAERQEELLQEVWLALWTALPRFEGRSSLRTWVYRVAHNTAVKHIHRQVRTPQGAEIDVETLGQQLQNVEARLDRHRARQMLADLIRKLPAADRQLMLLYLEGLTGAEIAEITGFSPSNVTTRLSRIRTALGRKEKS